jgi:hypothetical protein
MALISQPQSDFSIDDIEPELVADTECSGRPHDGLPAAPMLEPGIALEDEDNERLEHAMAAGEPGATREYGRKQRRLFRAVCNMFDFHRLCSHRACRSARACCGSSFDCFSTQYPALPAAVQGWAMGLIGAAQNGLTQQELDDTHPQERFAYRCWLAGLRAAAIRRSQARLLRDLRRVGGDAASKARR